MKRINLYQPAVSRFSFFFKYIFIHRSCVLYDRHHFFWSPVKKNKRATHDPKSSGNGRRMDDVTDEKHEIQVLFYVIFFFVAATLKSKSIHCHQPTNQLSSPLPLSCRLDARVPSYLAIFNYATNQTRKLSQENPRNIQVFIFPVKKTKYIKIKSVSLLLLIFSLSLSLSHI